MSDRESEHTIHIPYLKWQDRLEQDIKDAFPDISPKVLAAMRGLDREDFMPAGVYFPAEDIHRNVIIGLQERFPGASISQPSMIARMVDLLQLQGTEDVLEIGTGSGYQAAILAKLLPKGHVYSVDYNGDLADEAVMALRRVNLEEHVTVKGDVDGAKGYPEAKQFDKIIVAAAASNVVPPKLFDQLKIGGTMVIPLTPGGDLLAEPPSQLAIVTKRPDGAMSFLYAEPVWFVPLMSEEKGGWTQDKDGVLKPS